MVVYSWNANINMNFKFSNMKKITLYLIQNLIKKAKFDWFFFVYHVLYRKLEYGTFNLMIEHVVQRNLFGGNGASEKIGICLSKVDSWRNIFLSQVFRPYNKARKIACTRYSVAKDQNMAKCPGVKFEGKTTGTRTIQIIIEKSLNH